MQNAECKMQNEAQSRENVSVDKSFEFAVRIVNLYKFLTREHKEYVLSIRPEVRQQLIKQQEFWRSKYSKTLGNLQSVIYDSMLKANKIPSGTKNYMQVIELIIATEY